MKNTSSVFSLMTALIFSTALIGCETAPPTIQTGPDAELSFDGLHMVDNSHPVRFHGGALFSEFRQLLADHLQALA